MRLVAIDVGTRNFGVDVFETSKNAHWLYLMDLLVQRDASGRWCRFNMEERLVYDLCVRLVEGLRPKLKSATMVGIESQMTRRMAVVGNVLQAVIQERFPHVCVVKLSPRAVRRYMGEKLQTDLAGKKRTYKQSKSAASRTVKAVLGSKWTKYAAAFRKPVVSKKPTAKKRTEVRIDPGDAMLMALYMRDNLSKLRAARFKAPAMKRVTLTRDERPIRALKLTVDAERKTKRVKAERKNKRAKSEVGKTKRQKTKHE